jgi:hypothetical protein
MKLGILLIILTNLARQQAIINYIPGENQLRVQNLQSRQYEFYLPIESKEILKGVVRATPSFL